MTTATIDLNCDLGERDDPRGLADDLALLDLVTSANIACGGHAGDEQSMTCTVAAAIERGVALGAHPGYPDRANFGRMPVVMPLDALEDSIASQVESLLRIIDRLGGALAHVKAHGALYHAAMRHREIAETLARGVARTGAKVILIGQSAEPALDVWRAMGWRVAAEAFVDRRYEPDGALRDRHMADALIDDPATAAAQAVRIARGSGIIAADGTIVNLKADTLCLHSDTPHAIEVARAVRAALSCEGIGLQPS